MSVANLLGQDRQALASFDDRVASLQAMTATPTSASARFAFEHTFER